MTHREYRRDGIFRYPGELPDVAPHPTEASEPFYNRIIAGVRGLLTAQGVTITIEGVENVPTTGGALLAFNHTGYYDFIFGGVAGYLRGRRLVRFMAKREIYDVPVVGWLMNRMRHIRVDRAAGRGALDEAIARLNDGELVGIFPEGTISRSFEVRDFKTGAARIAAAANVPLIPVAMWGSQRIISKGVPRHLGRSHTPVWIRIGEPMSAAGDPAEVTARLRTAICALLESVQDDYEAEYGPFDGESWVPASRGGSAPTPEQADIITAQKKAAAVDRTLDRRARRAVGRLTQDGERRLTRTRAAIRDMFARGGRR